MLRKATSALSDTKDKKSSNAKGTESGLSRSNPGLVSFSSLDDNALSKSNSIMGAKHKADKGQDVHELLSKAKMDTNSSSVTMTSIERAIEVLAALVVSFLL